MKSRPLTQVQVYRKSQKKKKTLKKKLKVVPFLIFLIFIFDPAILLLGIYPKNPETPIQKNLRTSMFIPLFTIAKLWRQPGAGQ